MVKALLELDRVDADIASNSGQKPLAIAAELGRVAVVRMLLDSYKATMSTHKMSGYPLYLEQLCVVVKQLSSSSSSKHTTLIQTFFRLTGHRGSQWGSHYIL